MKSPFYSHILFIITILLITGCESGIFKTGLSEGAIEYDVTYPEMDPDNVLADFMPDVMTMKFKDNHVFNELSAGMGMFKTNFIYDCENRKMEHMVKLINKKYVAHFNDTTANQVNELYHEFSIIPLNGTITIAGFECQRALIVFSDIDNTSFYLHYTDQINIEDANWSNPFREIPYVMLEYSVKRNGIAMHFKATKVIEEDVEETIFTTPEDYKTVSYEELEKELNNVFESFNY